MERHKFFRDKFIELANKKFTDEDIFIRLSYKDKKGEFMENKKRDFEDCFESFHIELLQFKRRCKRDYGLRMEFEIDFRDEDGNFVRGVRTESKKETLKAPLKNKFSISDLTDEDIEKIISILKSKFGQC